jgi:hypothetical protein
MRMPHPILARSSIPADRNHRFRRSGVQINHAADCAAAVLRRKCRPGRPFSC